MKSKNNKAFRREHEQSSWLWSRQRFLKWDTKIVNHEEKKISLITLKLKPLLIKKLAKKASHRMYYMYKGLISIIYIHIHICVCTCVCVYICVCVYTYIKSLHSNKKKADNSIEKKWSKGLNRHFRLSKWPIIT